VGLGVLTAAVFGVPGLKSGKRVSVPPGGAEIVLRREGGCYVHIRIADVSLIPPAEQGKVANGIILGLCGDTRGWAQPVHRAQELVNYLTWVR
jgi:hypothetical protein